MGPQKWWKKKFFVNYRKEKAEMEKKCTRNKSIASIYFLRFCKFAMPSSDVHLYLIENKRTKKKMKNKTNHTEKSLMYHEICSLISIANDTLPI